MTRIPKRHLFAFCTLLGGLLISSCGPQPENKNISSSETSVPIVSHSNEEAVDSGTLVFTQDIKNFWEAYDAIQNTSDPVEQLSLLNLLYIDRGTPGLHAMNRARSYTSREYLQAINDYPKFWASVRADTMKSAEFSQPVAKALLGMREVYPDGTAVPVYFVIGALRAGGTANDGKLLIGTELAVARKDTPSHELGEELSHLKSYFNRNPIDEFIDLNLHEYVHTQQSSLSGRDLLSQSLLEGVAEYVSTAAIGRPSGVEAIAYGKNNHDEVLAAFEKDIHLTDYSGWIWNSPDNKFGTRDLGYYIGYVITEGYLTQANNKAEAIKTLIELDYRDQKTVEDIVDISGVFPKQVSDYPLRHGETQKQD